MTRFTKFFLLSALTLASLLPDCFGATPRGRAKTRTLQSAQEGHRLIMKNSCKDNIKIHARHYDGSLKYSLFENVKINQEIQVHAKRKVTVALVAVQLKEKDTFAAECVSGAPGYMKYSDGLCYKFYYSSKLNISCDKFPGDINGVQDEVGDTSSKGDSPMC